MFEQVTIKTIHALLNPLVVKHLPLSNFESFANLTWVRSDDAPIRQIFQFQQWKGGRIAPSWGLSLDFVPHLSGGRVKWHRTAKSALADIRIDSSDPQLDLSYMQGPGELAARAEQVVRQSLELAEQFWGRFKKITDLPAAVAHMRSYLEKRGGLGFYKYSQAPIAAALIFAANGLHTEATHEMRRYLDLQKPGSVAEERLLRLLTEYAVREPPPSCCVSGRSSYPGD